MDNKNKQHYKRSYKFIVGIDEAGRGPLAGPVCIGAVGVKIKSKKSNLKNLDGIKDSKKLSPRKREEWRKIIKKNLETHYVFISHKIIDKIGISQSLKLGVQKVLEKFSLKPDFVLMDGSLKAPKEYKQETIIKGDEKIPLISAASVIAKTARDRKMLVLHKKFPRYGLDKHKGYGTKKHYKKISKYGLCEVHRKTFCGNIN